MVIVGFMAQHTLGRRLVEGRKQVKVFGQEREVRARIHVLDGLSAHADQEDLLAFARSTGERGRVERIALVHGEDRQRRALAAELQAAGVPTVMAGTKGEQVEL